MANEVRLPELGEGIERAEVVRVLVTPGDAVAVDQPLLEIETDKANVEVPSPSAGVVTVVAVEAGATVAVGQLILSLADGGTADEATEWPAPPPAPPTAASLPSDPAPPTASTSPLPAPTTGEPMPAPARAAEPAPSPTRAAPESRPARPALAAPSVRKLAREIGVEINRVTGSGTAGRIGLDDVKAHARRTMEQLHTGTVSEAAPLPDFSQWGPVEHGPIPNLRRIVARRMSQAWQAVPHVTQQDQADVSEFEAVRRTLKQTSPGLPLTLTAFAVAVVAAALKAFPAFNASLDLARDEIIYKRYVNIGVAVDTKRGLIVPVIKDADRKSLTTLSTEIAALATKVRTTGASREDLQGGTFTITNLGGLGGTAFTPIVNYPEVAILGLSRSAATPVFVNDRFEARPMLPLSLSYDHRLIDGADAVRFLRWMVARIEHPLLLEL